MRYIGIDTGVHTGFAVWNADNKAFEAVETLPIHQAMWRIEALLREDKAKGQHTFMVLVEDARLRKWYGSKSYEKLQGAGSVKRDCKIWEDFLTDLGVEFRMQDPKYDTTKVRADSFKALTGWTKRTSEHGRDAAMMVFGR